MMMFMRMFAMLVAISVVLAVMKTIVIMFRVFMSKKIVHVVVVVFVF